VTEDPQEKTTLLPVIPSDLNFSDKIFLFKKELSLGPIHSE
jgi:hypothetical protein